MYYVHNLYLKSTENMSTCCVYMAAISSLLQTSYTYVRHELGAIHYSLQDKIVKKLQCPYITT